MYMCLNKGKLDNEPHSFTAFATEDCYVVLGSFYSYKPARTCSEPRYVERKLSLTAEVTTASGKQFPGKSFLVPVSNGYYIQELVHISVNLYSVQVELARPQTR